jgi:hypothetical protein
MLAVLTGWTDGRWDPLGPEWNLAIYTVRLRDCRRQSDLIYVGTVAHRRSPGLIQYVGVAV